MKIDINKIEDNPFRDFSLYPIDPGQVLLLEISYTSIGDFGAIPVREHPSKSGYYQQAAGHHRVLAAKKAGIKQMLVNLNNYSDDDMVEVMVKENLTQRGHNASATLDSVAAVARILARKYLINELSEISEGSRNGAALKRTHILEEGPGVPSIYERINGFPYKDVKENKLSEEITENEIRQAVSSLKASGDMARIMGEVFEEVEAFRAERRIAEEEEAKAEARRLQAELEEAARREQEAKDKAAKKLLEEQRREIEAEQKRHQEAEAELNRRNDEARQKDEVERQKIDEQLLKERNYDIRCVNAFRVTSHEKAFREAVTSKLGKQFIPKDEQLPLAQKIREEIDKTEKKRGMTVGSPTVTSLVAAHIETFIQRDKNIDEEERQILLKHKAVERVNARWKEVRRFAASLESAVMSVRGEYDTWDAAKDGPFPVHYASLLNTINLGNSLQTLSRVMLGMERFIPDINEDNMKEAVKTNKIHLIEDKTNA